jgi:hypothetical protein
MWIPVQESYCGQDQGRGAEPALNGACFDESLLEEVGFSILADPLQRGDLTTRSIFGKDHTAPHWASIQEHCANAAVPGVAPPFDAEIALLPEGVKQTLVLADGDRSFLTVNDECDLGLIGFHEDSLGRARL